mgnify:CR=1 FL=1
MVNKKCSSCGELKSTTQFSKYKKGKDGLQGTQGIHLLKKQTKKELSTLLQIH